MLYEVITPANPLDRGLPVDDRDHDFPFLGGFLRPDEDVVSLADVRPLHAVPLYTEGEDLPLSGQGRIQEELLLGEFDRSYNFV